jgi:anti-anti-sigma regulatory factor
MSTPSAKLLVWAGEHSACIRVIGRADFTSSVDFKTLLDELLRKGCHCFVLDLSECILMDSTFLGVLAGFGLKLSAGNGGQAQPGVELLNPNARITESLETLGVLHLFKLAQGPLALPPQTEPRAPTPANPTKAEVTRACLEAHQTLMDINPANVARFKEVTRFLAENLKKAGTP